MTSFRLTVQAIAAVRVGLSKERVDHSLSTPGLFQQILQSRYLSGVSIWAVAGALIFVCAFRFIQQPTFWLDETGIALSLRQPLFLRVFQPLSRGLYFPRTYLLCIAVLRDVLGYHIWVLRLLPSLAFIAGTLLWARMLALRAGSHLVAAVVAAALLAGANYWLAESIQVKQYTLEVTASLIPFAISDETINNCLVFGRRKWLPIALALLTLVSYTYLLALVARLLGWYVYEIRASKPRLNRQTVILMALTVSAVCAFLYTVDLRQGSDMTAYWSDCILAYRVRSGLGSGARLLADFIWGWHYGRFMPVMIAVLAPVQAFGAARAIRRARAVEKNPSQDEWGSRTLGSLFLLAGTVAASIVISYPICAGRLMLFTQPHTQLLALEGILALSAFDRLKSARAFSLIVMATIVFIFCGHRFLQEARTAPQEDIKPLLGAMRPELAQTVWVQRCSVPQVRSLTVPLPAPNVVLDTKGDVPHSGSVLWVLWTHMDDDCRADLDQIRSRAIAWHVVAEGHDSGLALAQF